MSGGDINATELVATLINQKDNLIEGIRYAQERIDGALTLLLLTPDGLYCARDKLGRTPVVIGRKEDGYCAVFESCSYLNLEYEDDRELGPGEIAVLYTGGSKDACRSRKRYAYMHVSMDLLRLSICPL